MNNNGAYFPGGFQASLSRMLRVTALKRSLRQGQKLQNYPPAHEVISDFLTNLQMKADLKEDFLGAMLLTKSSPYLPCILPLEKLQPIMIADMRFETHHRGKRLTLRVLTPPDRDPFLATIMEDETGGAVAIQLCQEPEDFVVPSEETIRLHRVCVIKEPYFRCTNSGILVVDVEHVSDLIWLESSDEHVPPLWRETDSKTDKSSSHSIRMQGNAAVQKEKWAEAERLYSAAITTAGNPNDEHLARLNRSFANLKLGRLESALEDARHRVPGAPASEKGLFREARALYELGEFSTALVKYEELTVAFPENTAVEPEMRRVRARIREQQTGEYAFRQMQKQVSAGNPYIDCAAYTAPVEVRASPGCGRGLFTNRSVKAGDLLICEKAFVYNHPGGTRARGGLVRKPEDTKPAGETGWEGAQFVAAIVQYLAHNPTSSQAFLNLHHGDYQPAPETIVDGRLVVDTFLVQKIVHANGFRAQQSSLDHFHQQALTSALGKGDEDCVTGGVWLTASYINHDCIGNCCRSYIGDVQIVRAEKDLDAGTEVRFPYVPHEPLESCEERLARQAKLGFQCDCAMCREAMTIPAWKMSRRRTLRDKAEAALQEMPADLAKVSRIHSAIEELRPDSEALCFGLEAWASYWGLSTIHRMYGRASDSAKALVKALELHGFDLVASPPRRRVGHRSRFEIRAWGSMGPRIVLFLAKLAACYKRLAPELVGVVTNYARTAYCIVVGERDTFEGEFTRVSFM